jgi:maleate isomerase
LTPTLHQFANAPLSVLALACTGSSYLLGRQAEQAWVDLWTQRLGIPVVTAGLAVVQALQQLGAKRLALASPYPSELTQASVAYWQSHGFDVQQVQNVATPSQGFHAIYTTDTNAAAQTVLALRGAGADAVLMLGTGMPSLQAIIEMGQGDGPPVLSSMLALMWRATSLVQPQHQNLAPWLRGDGWSHRAQAMGLLPAG